MVERREIERNSVAWPIRLWTSENDVLTGQAVNATAHGMLVVFPNDLISGCLRLGATYRVEAIPGTGDRFTCTAEARRVSDHTVALKIMAVWPSILVVDGDAAVGELVRGYFARRRVSASEASSAEEAFEVVRSQRPDLVLLDIGLPDLSGLDVLERIRRDDPRIGVIMMTGDHDAELARLCIDNGAIDCLFKPLDLEGLGGAVASSLGTIKASS